MRLEVVLALGKLRPLGQRPRQQRDGNGEGEKEAWVMVRVPEIDIAMLVGGLCRCDPEQDRTVQMLGEISEYVWSKAEV